MAHYRASIDTPRRKEVFAYLSDFSTTQEWDPGVVEAERLGQRGGRREGASSGCWPGSFAADPLTYRIVEYDAPRAVRFLGENATVCSLDRITFEPPAGHTNHLRRRPHAQGGVEA